VTVRKKTYGDGIEELIKTVRSMIRAGVPEGLIRQHMQNAGWSDEWFKLAWHGAMLLEKPPRS
jgi:hypothetical protein